MTIMISWICAIILMAYQDIQRLNAYPSPRNNKTSVFWLDTLHEDRTSIHFGNNPTGGLNTHWCAPLCCYSSFPNSSTPHNELWQLTYFNFFFTLETLIMHIHIHKPVTMWFIQVFPCMEFEQNHAMLFKSKPEIACIDLLPCPRIVISGHLAKSVF